MNDPKNPNLFEKLRGYVYVYRSAITGKFVTAKYARNFPYETVREKVSLR